MPGQILSYRNHIPRIAPDAFIAPSATIIGNVEIGALSGVWFGVIVRGDVHEIRIGERVNIQDGTVVHVTKGRFGTYIGDGVTIGHQALIHGCRLEAGCFIGMRATVMDGAVVESGAMVAAGALVPPGKVVKAGELWAGSPTQFKRALGDDDYEVFKRTTEGYVELGQEYRAALNP